MGCLAAASLWLGRRRAGGFLCARRSSCVLLAGPWWGYAAHRWDNPLQSNLEPRDSLMLPRQPASFYVSFPLRTLVVHPFRPDFSDDLLPKLHAELWSDWFGYLHGGWGSPTRLERVTASTQSVLGLRRRPARARRASSRSRCRPRVRVVRRRGRETPASASSRCSRVVVLRGVRGHADPLPPALRRPDQVELPALHHPVLGGVLGRGVELRSGHEAGGRTRRWPRSAGLYVVELRDRPRRRAVGGARGAARSAARPATSTSSTAFQQNSPNPGRRRDDRLPHRRDEHRRPDRDARSCSPSSSRPGCSLVGPPFYERGSGCTGTSTIICDLDFLAGGSSTLIRYSVQVTKPGPLTMTAVATLGGARRTAGRQHGELHRRFSRRLSGVLPELWRQGLNSPSTRPHPAVGRRRRP